MKSRSILFFLSLLITVQFFGQTFEEYKKQQESEFSAYKQKQQEFINQMKNEFDEYVIQQDKEFAEYLQMRWDSFKVFNGEAPPGIPKPPVKPEYDPEEIIEQPGLTKQLKNPLMIIEDGKARPVVPQMIKKSPETKVAGSVVNLSFYGNDLFFEIDKQIKLDPPQEVNETSISNYWISLSELSFGNLLNQMLNNKSVLNLNDWAYYLMLKDFASVVYPESEVGADLLVWNLMLRSGYKARIGFANNRTSILLPSYYTLYSQKFMTTGNLNYYVMKDLGTDNIQTYGEDYPGSEGVIDVNFYRPLSFNEELGQKKFEFDYQQNHYSIAIDYNKNVINFYKDYPQVNLEVYFNASVSPAINESVIRELSKVTTEMSEKQAVGFLLHFVQTAFNYEVDEKQFGKEKFLFAEETIYYPASDCEDRSVLFAYLVEELLHKKVIGLEYPGHVSTAVKLEQKTEGDYVLFNNEAYIIADATYENAPLGLTMPEYRIKEPKVIVLNNVNYNVNKKQVFWDLANKSGGFRGDQLDDIVSDAKGNTYLTGYFVKKAEFGNYALETENIESDREAFLVKYDTNKTVLWAKRINSNQNTTGYAILIDKSGDLYVTGSYRGEIDMGDDYSSLSCVENMSDVFVAKFSPTGYLYWIKKAGLDSYPQENFFTYNVKFSEDGESEGTTFSSENEYADNFGLTFDQDGQLSITGSFMNTTGFGLSVKSLKTDSGEKLDVSESLKLENDKLIEDEYEETIAGVFSVINHIKLDGFKMLGTDAQKTMDKYNPDFEENYPDIYKSIGKINFVFNSDGIITLETEKGKTVLLRELKLKDDARMKVVPYEDGNVKVEIFNGVQVGKFFVWFNLNHVKMFKKNGNILFDFDPNHSQRTMNLKEDILK